MADYKILQNIDLAQNEIKEVSKIANDRQDGEDKGLRIQTGNDTSLAFNRKIKNTDTDTVIINSIKGTVKDGTEESTLNIEPSKVVISNTKGTETSTNSTITIGLTTPDSEGKEHIEAVSPSIDIKTGKTRDTDYTHPYISLKEEGSKLELQSETVEIRSKKTTNSSLTMNGGITGVSNNIFLGDSVDTNKKKVSLNLNNNGKIEEQASTSITETVGTRSVTLDTSIKIQDSAGTPSIIEVNNTGIKASKGETSSYIDIQSNIIKEQSNDVTIQTPKVSLNLNESLKSASLTSTEGTITLNSLNVEIKTTNAINVGSDVDTTTLQSSTTNITSPTINIGTESPSTSVSIGKDSSDVTLTGRSNFSVTATNTNSKVQANDLKFNKSLSSNDIKIRWDSTLNSLVFEKA